MRGRAVSEIRRTAGPGLAILIVLAIVSACGGVASPTGPSSVPPSPGEGSTNQPTPGPDPAAVAAARTAIDRASLAVPDGITAIDGLRFTRAGVRAAADALAAGATGDPRWAATWVYASAGRDPAPLVPLLEDADPTIRAMAAAALLTLGERRAAAVLADLIPLDARLQGSEPPIAVGAYAAASLGRFVAGPPIADGASPDEIAAAWAAWLGEHGATMRHDPATGTWSAS